MPAAGAGILFRIILHFWQTQCRPLPNSGLRVRQYCAQRTRRHGSIIRLRFCGFSSLFHRSLIAYFWLRESPGPPRLPGLPGQHGGQSNAAKLRQQPSRREGSGRAAVPRPAPRAASGAYAEPIDCYRRRNADRALR